MVFSLELLWLFAAAMIISSIGFKNYVWFISLGYGFSVAGQGALMLFLYSDSLQLGTVLCSSLFIVYGLRLGGFLAIRELGGSYKKNMKGEIKEGSSVPFVVKVSIWITCALLYVAQVSGVFYRMANGTKDSLPVFIGAGIMALGLILESAADIQKSNAKKKNPRRFVDTGLYRLVRCPNYLGEMIFRTGALVAGIGAVSGWQWVIVAIGYIGIIFVMFSGARRLEIRQNKNYGNDPEYQAYVKRVPIMVPFIPLYSVEKYKWLTA